MSATYISRAGKKKIEEEVKELKKQKEIKLVKRNRIKANTTYETKKIGFVFFSLKPVLASLISCM